MRRLAAALLAATMLLATACTDHSEVREAGDAALGAIELPESWQLTRQDFTSADWRNSDNRWTWQWRTDTASTGEALDTFTTAATAAGWRGGDAGSTWDGVTAVFHATGYWMRATATGTDATTIRLAVDVTDGPRDAL